MVGTGTNQYKARNTDASAEPTQTPQIGQLHVQVESPNFGWPFLQKIDIFFLYMWSSVNYGGNGKSAQDK